MFRITRILHPTDFSEQAGHAFRVACALAKQHGALVVVLHVVPPPVTYGEAVARESPDDYFEQLRNEYLLPIRSPEPGVEVTHQMGHGDPADVIVTTALERGCDLIVMGTHGRGGLARLLMGSVAEHVLRKAHCPVLSVRVPPHEPGPIELAQKEKASAR